MARMLLRRLVGPIVLHDDSKRPDFVKWELQPTTGLLDGLAPNSMASPPGNVRFSLPEIRRSLRKAA